MLRTMERPANSSRSSSAANFAGLLAALALQTKADPKSDSGENESAFGDDVVTLSYDQALRNHARHGSGERQDLNNSLASETRDGVDLTPASYSVSGSADPVALRTASVTIRLSKAECTRLHQRAAEAGVTVSAYLRSCVLEADALRAQVKEALAQIKSAAISPAPASKDRKPWRFLHFHRRD